MLNAAEHAVRWLQSQGVDFLATLCGHGLDPLFHAAKQAGLRLIDARNEQTASYIADYYGRLTRRPGVCAVSSGVAHINALTGVSNAWFDESPMLLISGAGSFATTGLKHFQDMDQVATAAPLTRYARVVDVADRTVQIFADAWQAAQRGPVHLTFPMDVQRAEVASMVPPVPRVPSRPVSDPGAVTDALSKAHRPVIVCGSAIYYEDQGPALLQFAEAHAIPVVTPIWDRGVVNRPSPEFCGVIGAATGGPNILPDADLIIMAGSQVDYRVGFLHTDQPVVFCECGWESIRAGGFQAWLDEAQRRNAEFGAARRHPLMDALQEVVTSDTLLLIDGGSIGQWVHQTLCRDRYPSHWLTCGRSGVVGWGIGGAMAARIAYPDSPVILVSGDGSFTFNVADLECAVRQKLPFVAIVADDLGWGITRVGHVRQFGEAISSGLGPVDFAKLAQSLGARGLFTEAAHLVPVLRKALQSGEVTVIHVPIEGGNP